MQIMNYLVSMDKEMDALKAFSKNLFRVLVNLVKELKRINKFMALNMWLLVYVTLMIINLKYNVFLVARNHTPYAHSLSYK